MTPGQWMSAIRDPNWNVSENYHFPVIDRADEMPKIYTATGVVYGQIRKYATSKDWGDPRSYDITITRTEAPGRYYEVMPSPNKTDLMKSELEKVPRRST
jgi:hypothetical protein